MKTQNENEIYILRKIEKCIFLNCDLHFLVFPKSVEKKRNTFWVKRAIDNKHANRVVFKLTCVTHIRAVKASHPAVPLESVTKDTTVILQGRIIPIQSAPAQRHRLVASSS